jgi:hypothetical protein
LHVKPKLNNHASGGQPAGCVIQVRSSVRPDLAAHLLRPHRRRIDGPVKKADRAPPLGLLAMNSDQLAASLRYHKIEFSGPTPESEAEAKLFEAIESGALSRGRPGRKQLRDHYRESAQKCLNEANGNITRAREAFLKREMKSQSIERKTAENRWAEAYKTLFTDR